MSVFELFYLRDHEIATVTNAVREWCHKNACDIDSSEGRQAMSLAVNLVHGPGMTEHRLFEELSRPRA